MSSIELIKEQSYEDVLNDAIDILMENSINAYIDELMIVVPDNCIDNALGLLDSNGFLFRAVWYK